MASGDFLQGVPSGPWDRAQLGFPAHEGRGKVFVPPWQNEGLGKSLVYQAMKARSCAQEEDWSWKGSPGRDNLFQADAGKLLV